MTKYALSLLALALVALNQNSFAAEQIFNVSFSGLQETPPNNSTATGGGTLTFDTTADTLTFNNITYSGLSANSAAAHIHGPAAPGVAAGVLYPLFPTQTTVGSTSGSFNGTLSLVEGTGGFTLAQQVSQLESGQWYMNVHDANFPAGEIRGQILPTPEPSTLALCGLGTAVLLSTRRVRKLRRKLRTEVGD